MAADRQLQGLHEPQMPAHQSRYSQSVLAEAPAPVDLFIGPLCDVRLMPEAEWRPHFTQPHADGVLVAAWRIR
jgi:hypothetical protein